MAPDREPADRGDDDLMAALRTAVGRLDGPPAALHEANRGLLAWRDPDAALAQLVADSRQMEGAVRSGDAPVILRFGAGDHSLTVELSVAGPGRWEVSGRVEPAAGPGGVTVRQTGNETVATCDARGRFRDVPIGRGAVSFRWMPGDATGAVETPWLLP